MAKGAQNSSNGAGRYGHLAKVGSTAAGADALAQVSAAKLQTMIVAVISLGDAVTFGTTRDGGAVAICLLSNNAMDKVYGADVEELETTLDSILAAVNG